MGGSDPGLRPKARFTSQVCHCSGSCLTSGCLVFSLQNRGDNRTFLKVVKIEQVATCKVFRRVSDTQEVLNQFNYDFNYKFFIYSCKQQTFIEYLLCGPRACAKIHTHTHTHTHTHIFIYDCTYQSILFNSHNPMGGDLISPIVQEGKRRPQGMK